MTTKRLGFIRFFQILYACAIAVQLTVLIFINKNSYALDATEIISLFFTVLYAIAFWLIWQRKKVARWFIIVISGYDAIASLVYNIAVHNLPFINILAIITILYFLTSRRVKAVLTEPFSVLNNAEHHKQNVAFYQPKKWVFWRNLIIYFCVISVVGHWLEAAYCTLIRFNIIPGTYDPNSQIWSDWLYPFLVYGFGAAACILVLFPIKDFLQQKINSNVIPLLLSFAINALVCTLIELVMGLMLNQPLADGTMPLWDYRDMFANFMGQVCLQNAIAFGIIATAMTWIIYPGTEQLLSKLSSDNMHVIFVSVVVVFGILFTLYCIDVALPPDFEVEVLES